MVEYYILKVQIGLFRNDNNIIMSLWSNWVHQTTLETPKHFLFKGLSASCIFLYEIYF